MQIPVRAGLAAGLTAATAAALVAAPAVVLAPPELEPVVVHAEVTQLNAASDLITSVYGVTRYWANYASLELAPWALGWVPFGYLVSDQIYIWYPGGGWQPGFVLPVTDSFVEDFLNPVVNDPLDLGTWTSGIGAVANAAATGVVGGIDNEIRYALSLDWLPFPLPPLPSLAAAQTSGTDLALPQRLEELSAALRALAQSADGTADELASDLQERAVRIAALVHENSERIVDAGLRFAAGLGSAVPRPPERAIGAGFAAPAPDAGPAAAPTLVDVALPEPDDDRPATRKRPDLAGAPPGPEATDLPATPDRAEPPALNPRKALAAANDARRESAKKVATDVRERAREHAKSLRGGLRKATAALTDRRGTRGGDTDAGGSAHDAGSDKARESRAEAESD